MDLTCDDRLITGADGLPQLIFPRQTPAVTLTRRRQGDDAAHATEARSGAGQYRLYVTAGRTRDATGLGVLTTTEVLAFGRIRPGRCGGGGPRVADR